MMIKTRAGWWFGTFFLFPYIGNFIIPIDELIFFRGVGILPASESTANGYFKNWGFVRI